MKKEIELITSKTYSLAKPAEVLEMATVLKNYIVHQRLYTYIKGKNYAHVDGWQFAGFLSGMTAAVEEETNLSNDKEIKWKVRARLYQGNEQTPHVGVAICSNKETSKKSFDEYAVLSMAQTRAIGKAYRNRIGWIMKLAGYESSPSEEMRRVDETPKEPPQDTEDKTVQQVDEFYCHGVGRSGCPDGREISKAEFDYSKKVYGRPLCRRCQREAKPLKKK